MEARGQDYDRTQKIYLIVQAGCRFSGQGKRLFSSRMLLKDWGGTKPLYDWIKPYLEPDPLNQDVK